MLGDVSNIGDYNLVFNCWKPIPGGPQDIVNTVDPKFENAAANDFHLVAGSPAIDAGDPSFSVPSCEDKELTLAHLRNARTNSVVGVLSLNIINIYLFLTPYEELRITK